MNPNSGEQKYSGSYSGAQNTAQPNVRPRPNGPLAVDFTRNPYAQPMPQIQQAPPQDFNASRAAVDGVAPAAAGAIPSRIKRPKLKMKRHSEGL